ncbi:MAG: hypothetical protein ACRCZI_12020 [Cetobacterium sp.]
MYENNHLTTVINIQNTLSLKTRISDESEVGSDFFDIGADVLNLEVEDLQNLKFIKILDTSVLNTVYIVPRGTSQDYNFSENIKSNNPEKLIVSIMGSDGLMEASNIVENIKSKIQNRVNSAFVGTHYNPDITLNETVISIYGVQND